MSCLFDSLSVHLHAPSCEIRRAICDYLDSNRTILEGVDTRSLIEQEHSDYVSWMRRDSTWGGAIEIKAACDIWNVVIRVHNVRDGSVVAMQFVPSQMPATMVDALRTIDLQWNGGHYYVA